MTPRQPHHPPIDAALWKIISPLIDAAFADDVTDPIAFISNAEGLSEVARVAATTFAQRMLAEQAGDSAVTRDGLPGTRAGFDAAFLKAVDDGPLLTEGRRLGPWQVRRLLGRGGMGEVYLATRADGLHEASVALKVIRAGSLGRSLYARFERERRVLAKLVHPNIASLRDAGVADGIPYIALDYIEGEPITAAADARRLTLNDRIAWVLQVGEAIAHAHRGLIVHRDLKPSNILVDRGGHVTLLDFGIAKLLDDEATDADASQLTREFGRALSPDYAAPEQWTSGRISTQTDVYSLGVVLYEMLAGKKPFVGKDGARSDTTPIAAPSAAVTVHETALVAASQRNTVPQRWRRALQGDLDAIVMKALAFDREHRYASMDAMLDDLRRYLDGRPVKARGDWMSYRVRKFILRNPWPLAGAAAVLVALIGAAAGFYWQVQAVTKESAKTLAVLNFTLDMLSSADPDKSGGADISVRQALAKGVKAADALASAEPDVAGTVLGSIGSIYYNLNEFEESAKALRAAVAAKASAFGRESEQALLAEVELAKSLAKIKTEANLSVAQATYDAALKRYGPIHPTAIDALSAYASIAANWPGPDAETLSTLLGQRLRAAHGEKDWRVVQFEFDRAVAMTRAGKWQDALALMESLDANVIDPSGIDKREPVIRRYNIAAIRGRLGDFERAIPSLQASIAEYDQLLGVGNERSMEAVGVLASLYGNSGQFTKALPLLADQLVPYYAKRVTTSPELLLFSYAEWMAMALAAGDVAQVLTIADTAVPLAKNRFTKPIGSQAYTYRVAAMAHGLQRNFAAADALIADAIAIEKQLAPKGWPFPQTLGIQAAIAMQRGDSARAVELFAAAAKANAATQGGTPAGTARYKLQQATVHWARRERDAARERLEEAIPMLEKLPKTHPRWAVALWLRETLNGTSPPRPLIDGVAMQDRLGYYLP